MQDTGHVVFGPQYVNPTEVVFAMTEPRWKITTDYVITDVDGMTLAFRIREKTFSLHNRKIIYDANDTPIASSYKKLMSLHDKVYLLPGEGEDLEKYIFMAQKKIFSIKPELWIFMNGNSSDDPDITIKGSFFERDFEIRRKDGVLLGQITKKFSLMSLISDRDTFYLRIPPGIDTAFVVGLALIVDEIITRATEDHSESGE